MVRRHLRPFAAASNMAIVSFAFAAGLGEARAGVREEAALLVLKYAREFGVAVSSGVVSNYIYGKMHPATAAPQQPLAPRLEQDPEKIRSLVRSMLENRTYMESITSRHLGQANADTTHNAIMFLKSCDTGLGCAGTLPRRTEAPH